MNEDTIVAIQCYTDDAHQVQNAMGLYAHHGCPILILSPTDEPATVDGPGVMSRTAGLDAYMGPASLERHHAQMTVLAEYPQSYILLHESDSVCLSPEIPAYLYEATDPIIWANPVDTKEHIDRNYHEGREADPDGAYVRFPFAMQAPWFFTRTALLAMLEVFDGAAETLPDYAKLIDWWFLAAARTAGYECRAFPDGVSQPIWADNEIQHTAALVRDRGVVMVHSVKSKTALDALLEARA